MTTPTIINNLPKGNVKAPQGAIMKINTGEQLTKKDFNNNTEFVLEFTPDNLDPNGNPIYVRNGITEDEVVIGNNNKTILYNLELDDNYMEYDSEIRFYPILNSDIMYFLEVICQNPNNDSITLIKNNTSQLVQFYGFGNTFGVTNETDFGTEIPPGILFYVVNPIPLKGGQILEASVCYFRYFDSTKKFPSVNISCEIQTKSEENRYLSFKNSSIYLNDQELNIWNKENYEKLQIYNLNNNFILFVSNDSWNSSTYSLPSSFYSKNIYMITPNCGISKDSSFNQVILETNFSTSKPQVVLGVII